MKSKKKNNFVIISYDSHQRTLASRLSVLAALVFAWWQ